MLPGLDSVDDIAADVFLLPATTTTEQRVNKFQPKRRGKPNKPAIAVLKIDLAKEDAEVSTVFELEDAVSEETKTGKFEPDQHPKATDSISASSNSDDNIQHALTAGVVEAIGASNRSSSSCAPMDLSSLVNETQGPLDLNKISLTHEVASRDSQASEMERNLQTDSDQLEEEAVSVLSGIESHDDVFLQPSYTSVKQVGKFQPKSGSRLKRQKAKSVSFILPDAAMTAAETVGPKSVSQPKEKKAKSVSFSLPDGAETAASPVGEHPEVLADSLAEAEAPLLQIMNDEVVEKIPHSTSVFSENADIQLDHKSARSEDLADLSSLESFDSILSEPASVTGKTVPKFHPKPSAKTKTAKSNSSGNANDAKESTFSRWDSLHMDAEPLEDHTSCTTNLSSEQADPVEMSSLEAGSPEGDEVFETIDTALYGDNYFGEERNPSAVPEDAGNEVHPWSDDGQTQQTLDDLSTSEAFEEHGASKSSRELRKRISVGSSSGKLDGGISENWDVDNSDNIEMDEDQNDDEYKGEEMPKQRKKPKRSEKQMTDAQKQAKRRRKAKEPDSTRTEPPKKKFPHGTRRKRRQVDNDLLEKPEYELDRRQIVIRQLILLGEAKERTASKDGEALRNNQSNTGFFSNVSHFDQDNPYDDDNDPSGEKAHREFLINTKKVNYQTHMNREKSGRWSKAETGVFYEAIRQFGTDFGMIEKLFPNRTRRQVKSKYKTEERIHPSELRDAMSHRSTDHSHFEKVIQLLQTQAEEEPRQDDVNGDPTTVSQDAANGNEEERDQPKKAEQNANGFDGEAEDFEKIDEWDGDGASEYNEYEAVDWDAGASSPQNEEKYSEYDEFY